MNKLIELEKRFEKAVGSLENLFLGLSNGKAYSKETEISYNNSADDKKISDMSSKIQELENASKKDAKEIETLIEDLQSLFEKKDD